LVGDPPRELEEFLKRRQALGLDLFDEVWAGDYHVAPARHRRHGEIELQLARILGPFADRAQLRASGPCNIGTPDDYRVPDQAYFAEDEPAIFNPVAALVVEIVSPGDESKLKADFYFRVGVTEFVIVDPEVRSVEWFVRGQNQFEPTQHSGLLEVSPYELAAQIRWPD
jgi:Uma2 family endonuclease